ncbi:MAG: YaaR family protein [Clostridiales bacterium]|jgi:uncharacterized protein YaaR (DUF327 family)|nr:YaaR family protein [Clostridiales bacterium]
MDLKISEILTTSPSELKKVTKPNKSDDFSFTLNKMEDSGLFARLKGLIEDISEVGSKIAEHADLKDLKKYRGLITDFVNEVVTNSHKFSRENFLDRRGRHRVYGIVKLVNKNLDDLAKELLKKEKDHITILEKTGQIRGLLLDIII